MGLFSNHEEAESFGDVYYSYVKLIKKATGKRLKDLNKKEALALFFMSEENYRTAIIQNNGEVDNLSVKNLSDPRDLWRWLTSGLMRYLNEKYKDIEIEEHWEKMENYENMVIEWTLNGKVWYENLSEIKRDYKKLDPNDF